MYCRWHYVAAVEDLLHHQLVQFARISAGPFMASGDLFVDSREQGAGTAGEVSDPQSPDVLGARPVHAIQLGDGEPGQQRGGCGKGVEGGQVFAVGYEALEYAAGQVVGVFYTGCVDRLGGVPQSPQNSGGGGGVQVLQDIPGEWRR